MPSAFSLPMSAFSGTPSGGGGGMVSPSDFLFGGSDMGNMSSYVDPSLYSVPKIPGIGGVGSANGLGGLGLNMDTAKLALSGLGTIGNLYAAFQAQKLAKQQFDFTKGVTTTNLANQIKTYNTTLEDRSRSRAATEGQTAQQAQAYIDKNKLSSSL